jgi:hypothetical protein
MQRRDARNGWQEEAAGMSNKERPLGSMLRKGTSTLYVAGGEAGNEQ